MNFTNEFWIQICIYFLTFGITFGTFRAKLNYMEKKLEKHNHFAERVIALEQNCKSAHHRVDELKDMVCKERN